MNRTFRSSVLRSFALVLVASALVACGDDDDTGGGPIIMIDAGTDLGPVAVDMGPPPPVDMGPACMPEPFTPLPAAALPRCSAETGAAVVACGLPTTMAIATCIQSALRADTTAPLMAMGQMLDCAGCYGQQQLACFYDNGCNTQLDSLVCCLQANGCMDPNACPACSREAGAFQSCAGGLAECFDASSGFIGDCFAAPAPAMDAGTPAADAGTPDTDAGTPDTDAGAPDTDAGTPPT